MKVRALIIISSLLVPGLGLAQSAPDPVTKFCGAEPVKDPAQNAGIKRQERLLNRLLTTRSRVFRAYRNQYDRNRQRIINRNKKLPKQQHMAVPPALSDDELRAKKEYRSRESKAHASPAEEKRLQARLQVEMDKRTRAQRSYEGCRRGILQRMRLAASMSAEAIRKIPDSKRLAEERKRLAELREQHLAMLVVRRKDKGVMRPIISASLCAHNNLKKEASREIRVLQRESKNRDVSSELAAASERREEHALEITELKRDIKLHRIRAQRCGRKLRDLVRCVESHRRTAGRAVPPIQCKGLHIELELLGYYKRRWD
ncbi:MAG: hypothetical protein KJO07_25790 [Deltaproteobacteria bacterium]|jgi:hypothetical protein|nr:hypothetical protein [Deltaproteobacteria bacterium]